MSNFYCPECGYILYDIKAFINDLEQCTLHNIKYCKPCDKLYTITEFMPKIIVVPKPRGE